MKGSSLFALSIAILLGLGVVGVAKYTGLFSQKGAPPPAAQDPIKVLVASGNLFEGYTLTTKEVRVRNLRQDEYAHYQANREQYLPPLPEAAHLRVLMRNLEADQPILREYLLDQGIPDALHRRLEPGMRSVNLTLTPDKAGGGLIQLGERVDVYLTANVAWGGDWSTGATRTACLARNLKVIVKRNNLWTALAPVNENQPVHFTLQANPYRAALLEFAKGKGELTMVPTSATQERVTGIRPAGGILPASQSDLDSKEYRDEDNRIASFNRGELVIGEVDLQRIFNLTPPVKVPPLRVERYSGVNLIGTTVFGPDARADVAYSDTNHPANGNGKSASGFQFQPPAKNGNGGK
jgi:pilus assembly protein CpaB